VFCGRSARIVGLQGSCGGLQKEIARFGICMKYLASFFEQMVSSSVKLWAQGKKIRRLVRKFA
jgi:hypothetical protein